MDDQPKRIDRYEIVRTIGKGGFGIVYEARHVSLGHHVAIKQFCPNAIATRRGDTIALHNERDRDLYLRVLKQFEKTAVMQYGFDHPNILKVRDYIPAPDTGYMVTDYVDGGSLQQYLDKYGGHVPGERMFRDIFAPITDAVGYVHAKGHLHRDIAPDNIMIDRFDKPVLIDFGAMKRTLQETAIPGHAVRNGLLARGSYQILVTTLDAQGESRTYAVSEPIDVADQGAIAVDLPALSNLRFNIYVGTTDRPASLGACTAGPSEGPLAGQATQLAPNQRVVITAIGVRRVPPQPSSLIFVKEDYTPLEQQAPGRERPQGFHTDIFALGGTMYYALGGEPPMRASVRSYASPGDPYVRVARAAKVACAPQVCEAIDRSLRLPSSGRPQSIVAFEAMLGWRPADPKPSAARQDRGAEGEETIARARGGDPGAFPQDRVEELPKIPPRAPPPTGRRTRWRPYALAGLAALVVAAVLARTPIQGWLGGFPSPAAGPVKEVTETTPQPQQQQPPQPRPLTYCEQLEAFETARNAANYQDLRAYIQRCGSGGPYLEQARAELENRLYAAATSCIRTSSGCSFDGCVQIYTDDLPSGARAGTIRRAATEAATSSRCTARAPDALPDGTYQAIRGYNAYKANNCLARYEVPAVSISNGQIWFDSDKYRWQGQVDQRTGYIAIQNSGVRLLKDMSKVSTDGISITGHFADAVLETRFCGRGYFRILK